MLNSYQYPKGACGLRRSLAPDDSGHFALGLSGVFFRTGAAAAPLLRLLALPADEARQELGDAAGIGTAGGGEAEAAVAEGDAGGLIDPQALAVGAAVSHGREGALQEALRALVVPPRAQDRGDSAPEPRVVLPARGPLFDDPVQQGFALGQPQQQGGGMMSGLGQTMAQGMAFGAGSSVAHSVMGSMFGGGSSSHDTVDHNSGGGDDWGDGGGGDDDWA